MSRVPDSWPMDPPVLETSPSFWGRDAAAFLALLAQFPTMWIVDMPLKYLTITLDTRDGGFHLRDHDGAVVPVSRVLDALREAERRFGARDAAEGGTPDA